jgi:cbb3-type cytochrome oxidase subunit 3
LEMIRVIRVHPYPVQSFAMIDVRNSSLRIKYFAVPFLILSIFLLWNQWRVSSPDTALNTAREYLEGQFPGAEWELGKCTLVGQGLGKKWRLEFSSLQKDGRRIQANLLVDRWMPERIVGRFVLVLSPPQVVDGQWNNPTSLERLSSKFSRQFFFAVGLLFLVLQIFWLYRVHGRALFRKADGAILAVLGGVLMLIFTILEVHPGFMIAYPLILTFLGLAAGSTGGKANGRDQE